MALLHPDLSALPMEGPVVTYKVRPMREGKACDRAFDHRRLYPIEVKLTLGTRTFEQRDDPLYDSFAGCGRHPHDHANDKGGQSGLFGVAPHPR